MMAELGRAVVDLCRVSVGRWTLEGLAPGKWRELGAAEIDPMRTALDLPPRGAISRPATALPPPRGPQAPHRG